MISISPEEAADRARHGAVLVDVREPGERRRAYIKGSMHQPLSGPTEMTGITDGPDIIYYCTSGTRTRTSAARFEGGRSAPATMLAGGLQAWMQAGLPVVEDKSAPIDIMRQVMIAAGSLVLIGTGLGATVHPAFYGLSAFVGAGLMFSGVTGFCAMARLLSLAPWNR